MLNRELITYQGYSFYGFNHRKDLNEFLIVLLGQDLLWKITYHGELSTSYDYLKKNKHFSKVVGKTYFNGLKDFELILVINYPETETIKRLKLMTRKKGTKPFFLI